MVNLVADDPLSAELLEAVGAELTGFLRFRGVALAELGPEVADLVELARRFTAGGKRVRPGFCCWGYLAATGGADVPDHVIRAAASLDLLHVSALVHDDVMDSSATRRGLPSAHVSLATRHESAAGRGDPEGFGRAGAILLGNLLLAWSVDLFNSSGTPAEALAAAQPLVSAVRTEVSGGQYLDITAQTRMPLQARADPETVLPLVRRVVEYKTSRYTVVRPLQIGAALGGANDGLLTQLHAFGSPLGRAFQYRDDLLGVFGDSEVTGKPAGDDLREGKLTFLIANAMSTATDGAAARLNELLGKELNPEELAEARSLITATGAVAATEAEIAASVAEAKAALAAADLSRPALDGLANLATMVTQRNA